MYTGRGGYYALPYHTKGGSMNQARMRVMRDSELTKRLQDERLKYKDYGKQD